MPRYTVLIVDDEEEFREMTVKRLNKRDLECESASNGDTALEMVAKKKYDVILLDVKMPGEMALRSCVKLKKCLH